jgi:fumarate reductase subunit C
MRKPEHTGQSHDTPDDGNGQRSVLGFMFPGAATYPPVARGQGTAIAQPARPPAAASPLAGALELATSVSGVALAAFMLMHMSLLSTVLIGAQTMDNLASFLERYYLVQIGAGPLILLGIAHVFLAARKVPTTFQQQWILVRQMRQLNHLDTWTWALQVLSGAALFALISVHLWVMLTGLPIEAAKSGEHVSGVYIWFDIPFALLVQGHIFVGLYRIAVKWGLLARGWAYGALAAYTLAALALEFTITATFFGLGGNA